MTSEDFDYIRSVTASDRVWVGDEIAKEYYRDEMPEYGVFPPELYVEVLNKEEISAIMAYAYKENIPVVCRGAGTGLAGGATCKYGGIMLSVMRMNKIFPIDRKNQTITAEPGALLIDIQAAAAAGGLFYPPDPGEKTASIGGNVITNAGGMKAVRYGLTRDFVRCIEAVMPDGSIMNFSSNVVKNTTGYDVKDLVIGSEGTLCILTQVTLKLLPAPTCTCTLVMPFRSLEECADMVPKVLELPFVPTAIEFLERELIDIVERNLNKMFPVKLGEAVLIVMYDASSKQELDSAVEAAAEAALANGALDCCIAGTPERAGAVWSVRGGILEGMKADSVAQEECDVVVPRARIAEYVKAAKKIASAHGIRVEPCGHCGDGNIHTEMLRGPEMSDQEWKEATHASLVELYALSKELGGQLSGEHGIGNGRLEFLEEFAGPRMIALYKAIKLAFDDKLILNPGKVVEYNKEKMGEREMSQNKSLQSKMPLAMGLAFVAFTTQFGGEFASGAQIYQYFINYGIWCLILPAVTQGLYALFFWYGMRYAYKHKTYDYRSFSDSLYGKTKPVMSNLYEICYLIMIGTASAAAFATGGSTLQTLFGIPYWLCTLIIAAFIFVIALFGTNVVRKCASTLSVLIIIGLVPNIIAQWGDITASIHTMSSGEMTVLSSESGAFGPALYSAVLYFFFQLASVSVMYQHMEDVTDEKQINKAAIWMFVCNFCAMELSILGLLAIAYVSELASASVPMLVLVQNGVGAGILTPIISLLIILGAISTAVNMISGIVTRCVNAVARRMDSSAKKAQGHLGRNAVFTAIFTFLAFAIAQFGLMTVVKKGYAYLGYAAFITLFVPFVVHAVATKGKEI